MKTANPMQPIADLARFLPPYLTARERELIDGSDDKKPVGIFRAPLASGKGPSDDRR